MKDHTGLNTKVVLRRAIIDELKKTKGKPVLNILETCAGKEGLIYKALYQNENTTRLDIKPIPGVIKSEACKFIKTQGISGYDYFDIDTYGSPYRILGNIIARLTPGIYGFAITDGVFAVTSTGSGSKYLYSLINNKNKINIPGLIRFNEDILKLALSKICVYWKAHYISGCKAKRGKMIYAAFILRKDLTG
jgi:hypothetical protein